MNTLIGSDAEYEEQRKKHMAKCAVDTILAAEQHKKDPELKKHIKAEMKERSKHLESAMGKKKESKKEAPKKAAPAKKSAGKKK